MTILARYIAKMIIMATAFTALIFTAIFFLITLLNEGKNIGQGDYNLAQAIIYVLLRLPNQLYQFAPMLLLLGSIIGLTILSSHRELVVMRASGFSVRKIIYCVLCAVCIATIIFSILGEIVAPHLSYKAEVRKENARNAGEAVVTAAGIWMHVGNNFIHVRQIIGRHLLEDVTRYQFDDQHHLKAAYYAKKLRLQDKKWKMFDVVKTTFYPDQTKSESFLEVPLDLKFNANLLNVGLVDANEMSLPKLSKFARYLTQNGLQATAYKYEYWRRIFQPFASLVMIFLAIPFVLSSLSTVTMGWRIFAGILTGFAFFIFNAFLGQLCVVYQIPTLFAASLPLLLFTCFGFFLSNRLLRR